MEYPIFWFDIYLIFFILHQYLDKCGVAFCPRKIVRPIICIYLLLIVIFLVPFFKNFISMTQAPCPLHVSISAVNVVVFSIEYALISWSRQNFLLCVKMVLHLNKSNVKTYYSRRHVTVMYCSHNYITIWMIFNKLQGIIGKS